MNHKNSTSTCTCTCTCIYYVVKCTLQSHKFMLFNTIFSQAHGIFLISILLNEIHILGPRARARARVCLCLLFYAFVCSFNLAHNNTRTYALRANHIFIMLCIFVLKFVVFDFFFCVSVDTVVVELRVNTVYARMRLSKLDLTVSLPMTASTVKTKLTAAPAQY